MKACVFGAGAIGGHLAARMAKGGADVSVVARGDHLAAIQRRGLIVRAPDGELSSRPRASADPRELGVQDVVLVTTKAPALPQVAATIAPLLGPETAVVFVNNGMPWWFFCAVGGPRDGESMPEADPGDVVRQAVGIPRTIGSVVYSASAVVEPGVVAVESKDARLVLGELDGSVTPRVQAISWAIEAGGLPAPVSQEIRREVFAKFLGNGMSGPLCILARSDMATVLAEEAPRDAARAVAREIVALSQAYGWGITADPEARVQRSMGMHHKPSILQDLELGRPMEVEAQLLAPLRLARLAGVETPTLDLMVALARSAAEAAGLHR